MRYVLNVITPVGRQNDVYRPIKIQKSYRPIVVLNVIAAFSMKEIQEKSGNIDFLDARWSGVRSGRILNSSKLLCMSSLPASMKRIRSKQLRKRDNTVSPIISLYELSIAMETRVLIRSGPKPNAGFLPPQ